MFVKTDVFGVGKGQKRSTGPNVNSLGPTKENPPPKHVLMPMGPCPTNAMGLKPKGRFRALKGPWDVQTVKRVQCIVYHTVTHPWVLRAAPLVPYGG